MFFLLTFTTQYFLLLYLFKYIKISMFIYKKKQETYSQELNDGTTTPSHHVFLYSNFF